MDIFDLSKISYFTPGQPHNLLKESWDWSVLIQKCDFKDANEIFLFDTQTWQKGGCFSLAALLQDLNLKFILIDQKGNKTENNVCFDKPCCWLFSGAKKFS